MKITASLSELLTKTVKESIGEDIRKSKVSIYKATKTDPNWGTLSRGIAPAFKISKLYNKKRLKSILESTTTINYFVMTKMDPEPDWECRGMKNPYPYNNEISSCLSIIYYYHICISTDSRIAARVPKYFATVEGVSDFVFLFD